MNRQMPLLLLLGMTTMAVMLAGAARTNYNSCRNCGRIQA